MPQRRVELIKGALLTCYDLLQCRSEESYLLSACSVDSTNYFAS